MSRLTEYKAQKRIAVFDLIEKELDKTSFLGTFIYKCKVKAVDIWFSKQLTYFICDNLTDPNIDILDWKMTEGADGTWLTIFVKKQLIAGRYNLFATGTLWRDTEENE